ncbi:MAG TPA: hypothetical protein VEI54_06965 [Candidatus Limnocylindrales bacterium]|nr:hypothetical protein [Candidatus Limnocylindrales bacterium]
MSNLSLARIMYGTNEDFHAAVSMQGVSLRSPAAGLNPTNAASDNAGSGSASFSELLHRAWASLTDKK